MPKFYIVAEDWEVTSTDNRACAEAAAQDDTTIAVIDTEANCDLCSPAQAIQEDQVYKV